MGPFLQKFNLVILSLALVLVLAACSPRKLMVREFANMVEEGLPAYEQEGDLNLLAQSMPAHIKLLETLLANDPHNQKLLVLLARLYGGYAFAILESELEAQRLGQPSPVISGIPKSLLESTVARHYQTGARYALRSLERRYPKIRSQLNQLTSAADSIQSLNKSDVPALFWYGFNLAGFVQHRLDSVEALAKAHLVEKTMGRVIELNETYYHGNAYLALLVYHASRSPMMGGNPEKARKYYQRHGKMNTASANLGHVYWARYILVRQQEKEMFVQRLSAVRQIPGSDKMPTVLDRVAAVRARLYLESVDRFFD
jgi:tetratricopeptide (TPR) repeat protein